MPELPEVETIARSLNARVAGATLSVVTLKRSDIVRGDARALVRFASGRVVEGVGREGKRVVMALRPAGRLIVHLGMTGRLSVVAADTRSAPHTHLRIALDDGALELRFTDPRRFGGLWFSDGPDDAAGGRLRGRLGEDPLTISKPRFAELMTRRRQIKALLMDQAALAGMGNIYCDESLHAAGIHPLRKASDLDPDEVPALLRAIRRVLRAAIRAGGSTIRDYRNGDGEQGLFQVRHKVYGREGQPCKRCGDGIRRIVAAGRSSHVCPTCQPPRRRRRRRAGSRLDSRSART